MKDQANRVPAEVVLIQGERVWRPILPEPVTVRGLRVPWVSVIIVLAVSLLGWVAVKLAQHASLRGDVNFINLLVMTPFLVLGVFYVVGLVMGYREKGLAIPDRAVAYLAIASSNRSSRACWKFEDRLLVLEFPEGTIRLGKGEIASIKEGLAGVSLKIPYQALAKPATLNISGITHDQKRGLMTGLKSLRMAMPEEAVRPALGIYQTSFSFGALGVLALVGTLAGAGLGAYVMTLQTERLGNPVLVFALLFALFVPLCFSMGNVFNYSLTQRYAKLIQPKK